MNIICKVSNEDEFDILEKNKRIFNLNDNKFCHYSYFDKKNLKKYLNLPGFFSAQGIDLLNISLFVYFADRLIERTTTYDSWTREIKLFIPVLGLEKCNKIKMKLEKMLKFLSGDYWQIEFRKRDLLEIENNFSEKILKKKNNIDIKKISMLSGGLDSYIGAIDLLEDKSKDIIFISHYGGGNDVSPYQKEVISTIIKEFELNDNFFIRFHAKALKPKEDTTRTRSFMFFSHAIAVASSFNKEIEIIIPENGFISLNIPLTNSRLGSSSTRTTHPYYMKLFQEIINDLEINVNLYNPYQFKTKGEMIIECKKLELLKKTLYKTMSCSHSSHGRYEGDSGSHCGYCVPCIIRKASINKANIEDESVYRKNCHEMKSIKSKTAITNINSFKISIEKYKNMKGSKAFKIQESGPIENNINEYIKIYERGMQEIIDLLEEKNEF